MADPAPRSRYYSSSRSEPPPSEPGDRSRPGWSPDHNDCSLEAADHRARKGLRRADRALEILGELVPSFEAVRGELKASNDAWADRWKTLSRLGWAVGVPLLVGGIGWSVARLFNWLSTFHR